MTSGIERLRRELLPGTLEHAATHVPYYRRRWGSKWKRVKRPDDLHLLPLLTKDEAIAHQRELLAGRQRAYGGTISSGTMHGEKPPLRVLHTADEARALDDFRRRHAGPPGAHRPLPGFVLEVRAMHHGMPEGPPAPGRVRVPWTYTANALRLIRELLAAPQADGSRAMAMNIGAGALMALTAWLTERGDDPKDFRLQEISTYGFRLSPRWRAHVERVWRTRIWDNFSLSELKTPAVECSACGWFHWLEPPLVFEVVDHALVLTGLFPFVQAMPLVRYTTGDCVELGPRCRAVGDRGFRFRGRMRQCVFDARGKLVVSAQDVQDFLEDQPLVAREPHPCNLLGLVKSPDIGSVKFELDVAKRRARVELRCDPLLFPETRRAFEPWFTRHKLQLQLVGPGTLAKPASKLA